MIYIEPPFDKGFPWYLVAGEEHARISEETAQYLSRFGLQIVQKHPNSNQSIDWSFLKNPPVLSKRALTMLLEFFKANYQ